MITFRRTVPEDIVLISDWITQDEGHRDLPANFFIECGPGVSSYTIEDEQGPVIFVRQERETEQITRLHTQFVPNDRIRVVTALNDAYPVVAADALARDFKQIRFESRSAALVKFMFRFGFRAELIADL
jgi:hypothetical protein